MASCGSCTGAVKPAARAAPPPTRGTGSGAGGALSDSRRKVLDTMPEIEDLVAKYDVPAPRYTSFPSVPFWNRGNCPEVAAASRTAQTQAQTLPPLGGAEWLELANQTYHATKEDMGIALYIHLP
jgi:hypothetical protein